MRFLRGIGALLRGKTVSIIRILLSSESLLLAAFLNQICDFFFNNRDFLKHDTGILLALIAAVDLLIMQIIFRFAFDLDA